MKNTREEEEEKLHYPKLQHGNETTPKTLHILLFWNPGGIYTHQGRGGPGDKPWPEAARAPRPYGRGNVAWAAFSRPLGGRARGASSHVQPSLSPVSSGAWFLVLHP